MQTSSAQHEKDSLECFLRLKTLACDLFQYNWFQLDFSKRNNSSFFK